MLTESKYMAIAALSQKMLNGRAILADTQAGNADVTIPLCGFASKYCSEVVVAAGAQIMMLEGNKPTEGLGIAIMGIMANNRGNLFTETFAPMLASQHHNWSSAYYAAMAASTAAPQEEKAKLIRDLGNRAFDVLPITLGCIYNSLDIADIDVKQGLSIIKSGEAHLAIQGILDSESN